MQVVHNGELAWKIRTPLEDAYCRAYAQRLIKAQGAKFVMPPTSRLAAVGGRPGEAGRAGG